MTKTSADNVKIHDLDACAKGVFMVLCVYVCDLGVGKRAPMCQLWLLPGCHVATYPGTHLSPDRRACRQAGTLHRIQWV